MFAAGIMLNADHDIGQVTASKDLGKVQHSVVSSNMGFELFTVLHW